MDKRRFVIDCKSQKVKVWDVIRYLTYDTIYEVIIQPYKSTRTLEQNKKMWAMLNDLSEQVDWFGNELTPEDWKHLITAQLRGMETVPGIDGGLVTLGLPTHNMTIEQMGNVIEAAYAVGAEMNVEWTDGG